jgi:hypothetical protein
MGVWDDKLLPSETKLMVNYNAPEHLKMYDKATCIRLRKKSS